MKPLFTCILLLIALLNHGQPKSKPVNIILTGHVKSFEAEEKPNIYYAISGKKFNNRDRIKMDAGHSYTFDLSKTVYKNAISGILVFSLDSTYDINHKYSCVHRINLGEINKYANSKSMKVIKLQSDLVMEFMCESSIEIKEAKEDEMYVVGSYKQLSKDSACTIKLEKDAYEYHATFNYPDKDLMDEWVGNWSFVYLEDSLQLYTSYRINRKFGTMLSLGKKKVYKIRNENGSIELAADNENSFVRQHQ